jgi:hypothetical protein
MQNNGRNNRRDSQNPQFGQPRTDGGLLDDALLQIIGRDEVEGATQGDGIQSEEERTDSRNRQNEKNLELFAKSKGAWIDEPDEYLEGKYGKFFAHGSESYVYRKDFDTVVKTRSFIGYNTVEQALTSIKIHNLLFPETALKIVAFGRSFDEFNVVMEQTNIDGNFADKDAIEAFVKERFNAEKDDSVIGGNSYKTDEYLLQDLKPKNVLVKKVNGEKKFFVIDGDFYYNNLTIKKGN